MTTPPWRIALLLGGTRPPHQPAGWGWREERSRRQAAAHCKMRCNADWLPAARSVWRFRIARLAGYSGAAVCARGSRNLCWRGCRGSEGPHQTLKQNDADQCRKSTDDAGRDHAEIALPMRRATDRVIAAGGFWPLDGTAAVARARGHVGSRGCTSVSCQPSGWLAGAARGAARHHADRYFDGAQP